MPIPAFIPAPAPVDADPLIRTIKTRLSNPLRNIALHAGKGDMSAGVRAALIDWAAANGFDVTDVLLDALPQAEGTED